MQQIWTEAYTGFHKTFPYQLAGIHPFPVNCHSLLPHLVDGVPHGVAARFETSRHLIAPDPEAEGDEESGGQDHDAHQAAHEYVHEGREEAGQKF